MKRFLTYFEGLFSLLGLPLFILISIAFNLSDKWARRLFWPCVAISYVLLGVVIWWIKCVLF